MLDSVNRLSQSSVEWGQASIKKTTNNEHDFGVQANQTKAEEGKQIFDQSKLNKEIDKVNNQLEALNHSLRMKFSEEAEQFYVEVIDVRTNEVIDSIPGKHMIDLAAKLKDMIGFFIDEKR